MPLATQPKEIENCTDPQYSTAALFGYVSGLPDPQFLQYVFSHRFHKVVRRIFFSEIGKRSELDIDAVDTVGEALLSAIQDGSRRSTDETLIRYLIPHMSMQMRARTFRVLVSKGTKTTRTFLLRRSIPETTPGIEEIVLTAALQGDEDALVGIIYRWPPITWKGRAADLFNAADELPWLQRQIILKSDDPDMFLERKLIKDPVTELYIRARYHREASETLMDAALQAVARDSDRAGLVAWCLGRYGAFGRLEALPSSALSVLPEDNVSRVEMRRQP